MMDSPPGIFWRKDSRSLWRRLYRGLVMSSLRYLAMAPTFFAMDHSLSLSTRINFFVVVATLLRASMVIPQVRAASPRRAITWLFSFFKSRALAIPRAAERAVPAWPAP